MPPARPPPARPPPNSPPRKPRVSVGDEIEVYWPLDDAYYRGVVARALPKRRHRVFYDDGDVEDLDLDKEQWRPYRTVQRSAASSAVENTEQCENAHLRTTRRPPPSDADATKSKIESDTFIADCFSASSSRREVQKVPEPEKEESTSSSTTSLPPRKRFKTDQDDDTVEAPSDAPARRESITKVHQLLCHDGMRFPSATISDVSPLAAQPVAP